KCAVYPFFDLAEVCSISSSKMSDLGRYILTLCRLWKPYSQPLDTLPTLIL
ncbi:unnamed protein product, partial [Aphanomyces euteiches]